jgi:hypothetical protein
VAVAAVVAGADSFFGEAEVVDDSDEEVDDDSEDFAAEPRESVR